MKPRTITEPYFPNDLHNYAPWVAEHGLTAAYGECQCGCGETTAKSKKRQYKRGLRKGDPQRYCFGHVAKLMSYESLESAFFSNVTIGDKGECWLWQGTQVGNGYGRVRCQGEIWEAHRLSYELNNGPVPDGLNVCHECDTPLCVNPHHLFLGDDKDNQQDAKIKDRNSRGERHGNSKLSDADILAAAYRQRVRATTIDELAARYGVGEGTIHRIGQGKSWKHVPEGTLETE